MNHEGGGVGAVPVGCAQRACEPAVRRLDDDVFLTELHGTLFLDGVHHIVDYAQVLAVSWDGYVCSRVNRRELFMRLRYTILLCIAVLAASPGFADSPPESYGVYIFSGQSNMEGSGNIADLSEEQMESIPNALFWNGNGFESITPGQTKLSRTVQRFGPELQFARRVGETGVSRFYVIKYAASGQPLDRGMHSQTWLGDTKRPGRSNFYPGHDARDPNMGTRYRGLLDTVTAALAHLESEGIRYHVRGFIWMQGEADGKHAVPADRYARNLRYLHERLIEDIESAPCPLIFGQVLPHTPPAARFTHRDEVRQSMANADHASGHPDSYEWAWMVSTDGIELREDTVHYSSKGNIELGNRFFDAYMAATK